MKHYAGWDCRYEATDFEQNLLNSITYADASVCIRRVRLSIFCIGLNEKLGDSTYIMLEDKTITTETFQFLRSYKKYGEFMERQDGYWYGFSDKWIPPAQHDAVD